MDTIRNLLRLVDAFAVARNVSDARASTLIFGDGTRVKHLRGGGDMGVKRIRRAHCWLSEHWPADAIWPDDIHRPDFQSSIPNAVPSASMSAFPQGDAE